MSDYGPNVELTNCNLTKAGNVEEAHTWQWTTILVHTPIDDLLDDYKKPNRMLHWCFDTYGPIWLGFRIKWPFPVYIGLGRWSVEYAASEKGVFARYWFKHQQDAVFFKLTWL